MATTPRKKSTAKPTRKTAKKAAIRKSAGIGKTIGPKTGSRKKVTSRKKTTTRKKMSARKYSPGAASEVGDVMDEMKHGKLRSGGSGKKVTNPKQAIAIGLSEARRSGEKVPPNPNLRKKKP